MKLPQIEDDEEQENCRDRLRKLQEADSHTDGKDESLVEKETIIYDETTPKRRRRRTET